MLKRTQQQRRIAFSIQSEPKHVTKEKKSQVKRAMEKLRREKEKNQIKISDCQFLLVLLGAGGHITDGDGGGSNDHQE